MSHRVVEIIVSRSRFVPRGERQNPLVTGCIASHLCKRSKGGAASVV